MTERKLLASSLAAKLFGSQLFFLVLSLRNERKSKAVALFSFSRSLAYNPLNSPEEKRLEKFAPPVAPVEKKLF